MIVPMMKLSLLIFYKEYQTFLGELREKGMVHIHENTERTAEDTDLQAKLMLIRRTGEMITRMQSRNDVEQVEKVKVDDEHLLDYLEGLYSRQDQIEQQLAGLEKDHAAYRPWGKIFPGDDPKTGDCRLGISFLFRAGTEVSAGMGRDV